MLRSGAPGAPAAFVPLAHRRRSASDPEVKFDTFSVLFARVFGGYELCRPPDDDILVRIHASSLNFHDFAVVSGRIPTRDGRIPLSDGTGLVEAVGESESSPTAPSSTIRDPQRPIAWRCADASYRGPHAVGRRLSCVVCIIGQYGVVCDQ